MEAAGLTPADFGLAVRSHPGTLLVTARNKMRTANQIVREVGLAGKLVESSVIHAAEDPRLFNLDRLKALVAVLEAGGFPSEQVGEGRPLPGRLFRDVPGEVVNEFISAFAIHPANIEMQPAPLLDYIRRRGLSDWDVVLVSSSTAEGDEIEVLASGAKVGLQSRAVKRRNKGAFNVSGEKRRVRQRIELQIADVENPIWQVLFERHSDRWIKSSQVNGQERGEWFSRLKAWTGLATLK